MKLHPSRLLLQTSKNKKSTLPGTYTCGRAAISCLQSYNLTFGHENMEHHSEHYQMSIHIICVTRD